MNKIILYFTILFLGILLSSCQTTGSGYGGYSKPVSPQCNIARSQFNICYGNCLSTTPGSTLNVMSQCGYRCQNYSMQVARFCN